MLHGLDDLGDDFGLVWSLFRFTRQSFQELCDDLLDLARRSPPTSFVIGFETTV